MSTSAFKLVHNEDLRERIDSERLDAAEMEWQRHYRVWRCALATLEGCEKELQTMAAAPFAPDAKDLASITERLTGLNDLLGSWLNSPKTMVAKRAEESKR